MDVAFLGRGLSFPVRLLSGEARAARREVVRPENADIRSKSVTPESRENDNDLADPPKKLKPPAVPLGLGLSSGEAKVAQSIWLILATSPGERVMRPTFGCGIHDLVFEPNTSSLHDIVVDRVRTALVRYEPRIDVLKVETSSTVERPNELLIDIEYAIRSNNAVYNLVYPFYLQEGSALGRSG